MKIELDKNVALPVPTALAWSLIQDIETVAGCMPGAKITEKVDDTHYKGAVVVKLGPATVSFSGEITILQMDSSTKQLRIVGKGSDSSGNSGASLDLTGCVTETGPNSCELKGKSEIMVTGKVAAFGARLMGTVSEILLKQFFDTLTAKAVAAQAQAEGGGVAGAESTLAPPPMVETKFNALAFAWSVIKAIFGSLFGRARTT